MVTILRIVLPLTVGCLSVDCVGQDSQPDVRWIDGRSLPLEGRAFDKTERFFDRLPENVSSNVNEGVRTMMHHSSGMQFRFMTDSPMLKFRWKPTESRLHMDHMPSTAVSGIDVYRFDALKQRWTYVKTGRIWDAAKGGSLDIDWTPGVPCLVNLPLYNGISEFSLGVAREATVRPLGPRKSGVDKPVVFYGTSITQGGCCSRPGLCFVNWIGRDLDVPVVGLGFSDSGVMELEMSDHLAKIDASCYVLDCLWNMGTHNHPYRVGRHVEENYEPFVRNLRARRPEIPIVMAEHSNVFDSAKDERDCLIRRLYEKLVAEGWRNLVYLPNDEMYDEDGEGTVDGVHPNDLGMRSMKNAFGRAVRQALGHKMTPPLKTDDVGTRRGFTCIQIDGENLSEGVRTAGSLVRSRIADRTELSPTGGVFRLSYVFDAGMAGETARVEVRNGTAVIRAGRTRGFVSGSGVLLKSIRYGVSSFMVADGTYDFVPAKELRMAYLSRHFLNSFMEVSADRMCRYLEDLALDGVNAFAFPYGISEIDAAYEKPERIAAFERTSKAMYDRLVSLDCGYGEWGGSNQLPQNAPEDLRGEPNVDPRRGNAGFNACPEKPGALEALFAWRRQNLAKMKDIKADFLCHWSFDEGGCNCPKCRPWGGNGMQRLMEKLHDVNAATFPAAKTIFSTWYFHEDDFADLWKYLASHDWIDYVLIADPGIDPDYPLRYPPPGRAKLITFPEISMWGRLPWGGFGAVMTPRRLEKCFRSVEKAVSGYMCYSEGFFEDVNKAVVNELYVNPVATVDGILRRYATYHFAGADPEDFVRLAALLEKTHRIEDQKKSDLDDALALAEKMDREMLPFLRTAWRWRLIFLRAKIDHGVFGTAYKPYGILVGGDKVPPQLRPCFDELSRIFQAKNQISRFLAGYRYGATAPLYIPEDEKVQILEPPEGAANDFLQRYFNDQMIKTVQLGPGVWRLEPMRVKHVNYLEIFLSRDCRLVRPDGTPYEKAEDAFLIDSKDNIHLRSRP